MAHYGEASQRLIKWIMEDKVRSSDFYDLPEVTGSIQDYLNFYTYKEDIIRDTITLLMKIETERVIYNILGFK